MQKILRWFLIVAMLPALSAGTPANARLESPQAEATVTVDTLTDNYDLTDNKCSIREAMMRAASNDQNNVNTNDCAQSASGNTKIKFAVAGTIVVSNGVSLGVLPYVTNRVTLQGPITLDFNKLDGQGLVEGSSNAKFNLIDVTIKNSKWTGLVNDAGGELNIVRGKFENNSAGGAGGGAIRTYGVTTIAGTEFVNNKAVKKSSGEGTKDGGAIRSTWKLNISAVKFEGNVADGRGGAIHVGSHSFDIADTQFKGNTAKGLPHDLDYAGDGGTIGTGGGAIFFGASGNTYPSTIKRSAFNGNTTLEGSGGAIFHEGSAMLTVSDSSFNANHVGSGAKKGAGGAILNWSELALKRVMFAANSATGDGGALANEGSGQVKIVMSGFTGNNASGNGGAITHLNTTSSEGKIVMKGVAVSGNVAGSKGGGIYNHDSKYDKAELRMVVMAGNLPTNCLDKSLLDDVLAPPETPDDDMQWPVDSKGQNSFSDPSCDKPEDDDAQNADPKLDPNPAENGSPTPGLLTQMPAVDSPLVDKIPAEEYNPENDPDLAENKDIRGMPRVANGKGIGAIALIDIGPVERDEAKPEFSSLPAPAAMLTIGTTNIGSAITKTNVLNIYNGGVATLNLSAISIGGANAADFTANVPATISGGGTFGVDISCKPTANGARTATLSFNTNDTRPGKGSASYTLKCTGQVAAVAGFNSTVPAPGPINESTVVGVNDPFVITIQEVGSAQLTLSAPVLTSVPAGSFVLNSSFPFTIANGGASKSIVLDCIAGSVGIKTGTLSFATNDPTRPNVTFNLVCEVDKAPDPVFGANYWSTSGLTPDLGPYGISVSPDGKHAYVADQGSSRIVIYRVQNNAGAASSLSYLDRFDSASLTAGNRFTSPQQVLVSPDGSQVFATGSAGDSVTVFDRNAEDGVLTWLDTVHEGSGYNCPLLDPCAGFIDGMNGAHGLALSPDGRYVYVSSINDSAITVLRRDDAGRLSALFFGGVNFVQKYTNPRMTAAYGMAMSPDGAQLYATGYSSDALLVLKRDPIAGTLSSKQVITPSTAAGLDGVFRVIVSADGRYVYTAGGNSGNGGVCAFARNSVDGTLTYKTCYTDSASRALDGASDLALSPDGQRLFVTSRLEHGVNAFRVNPDTGSLTFLDAVTGTTTASGYPLQTARGVAVSPDGRYVYATGHGNDAVVSLALAKPVPLAQTLLPVSAQPTASPLELTVKGIDFQPDSVVQFQGVDKPTQYINSSELRATIASADLGAAGSKQVGVRTPTPGGGTSNVLAFTTLAAGEIPVPSVAGVNVGGIIAGSGDASVTVLGTGFVNGAKVLFNGSERATTFISATQLSAVLTAADLSYPGDSAITVQNPAVLARADASSTSRPVVMKVVAPTQNPPAAVSALSPAKSFAFVRRSTLEVTVTGIGFLPGAQARWNGDDRQTRYVNDSTVVMSVSAADLAYPNSFAGISVVNPAPGGGESSTLSFQIEGPEPLRVMLPVVVR